MTEDIRNVVVIGSGPAGWTAALYTGRAELAPLVFEGTIPNTPGGQLMITDVVENYPGFPDGIDGPEMMDKFKAQAVKFGAEVISDNVTAVDFSSRPFTVETESSGSVKAKTVIISTGAHATLLGIEKEDSLMSTGGGVSACATCDGALFKDMEVCVVGGGDTAMEEATFLTRFCSKVTLIHRREGFRSSKIMTERAQLTTEEKGPIGTREVISGLRLKDTQTGEMSEMTTDGLFVAIGHKPNSEIFADWLDLDEGGYLMTEGKSSKTKVEGVFACGDVQDSTYRQAITASGSGCMAAIDAERFLAETC